MLRVLLGLGCLSLAGCFNGVLLTPVNTHKPLEETVLQAEEKWTRNKIALIDVSGLIVNQKKSGLLSDGENPVAVFRERLDRAAEDKNVKAVVVRINSPGGGVTASDIMYRDLLRFKEETGKPVVVCMMDVCASGGYYLAMAADHVVAHPTTTTGSIGVIMSLYNAQGLCTRLGIESDPIKSGPNKDLANPARKLSDEERGILQAMVDQFYGRFVAVVAAGRQLTDEEVRAVADGRVYSASEALDRRLIDQIGYLEDAVAEARRRAGIREAKVVAYQRSPGAGGNIYAAAPRIPSEIAVKLELPGLEALGIGGSAGAGFMYLWMPGAGLP